MSPSGVPHPSDDELIRYFVDREPAGELEVHLLHCDRCQARLSSIYCLHDAYSNSPRPGSGHPTRSAYRLQLIKPDPEDST